MWWRLLRPSMSVGTVGEVHDGEFRAEVVLAGGFKPRAVAGLLKSMLDGLISAAQAQRPAAPQPDKSLTAGLSLLGDPLALWGLLIDDRVAVLGARQLVRAGKVNLVWNPEDDRCSAITVSVRPAAIPSIAAVIHAAT
jgi:hypothetical protein